VLALASCKTGCAHLYWYGANRKICVLRREQYVWRLIDGKAQYVHYRIFDKPDSTDLPSVDGVRNGKCEYGLEILIALAYLVYWTGMSIDKACGILAFLRGLSCQSRRQTRCFSSCPRTGRWNTMRSPN